jgi:hypothetical protein
LSRRSILRNWWVALVVYGATSCSKGVNDIEPEQLDIVLALTNERVSAIAQSPDGAVFVATTAGIFRSNDNTKTEWARLVEHSDFLMSLYAPSESLLFALSRRNRLYRWSVRSGLEAMENSIVDSISLTGTYLNNLWGTDADNVYVVGNEAVILHYDGLDWQLEANPLQRYASMPVPEWFKSSLWDIDQYRAEICAVGGAVICKATQTWEEVRPTNVGFVALGRADSLLIAGFGKILYRALDNGWEPFRELREFRGAIRNGDSQPDGSALFWSSVGDVAEVRGETTHVYVLDSVSELRGGITQGSYLYVAGSTQSTGIVARVRRK